MVELADLKQAEPLFEALCAGGLAAAEITLRTAAGLDAIRQLVGRLPDGFHRCRDGAHHSRTPPG